jgi:serine protease Do
MKRAWLSGVGLVALAAAAAVIAPRVRAAEEGKRKQVIETERVEAEAERLEAEADRLAAEADREAQKAVRFERRIRILAGGGRLGVRLEEVKKEDLGRLKLTEEQGARIQSVESNSPAAKAGLKDDDVVLRYQNQPVESAMALARMVHETPAGRTVTIEVCRGGATQKVRATLAEGDRAFQPGEPGLAPVPPFPPIPPEPPRWHDAEGGEDRLLLFRQLGGGPRRLGVGLQEISGQLARYFKLAEDRGVLVVTVEGDSAAAKAGIKAGDVILKFEGQPVRDADALRAAVRKAEAGKKLSVSVSREGKLLDLEVTLPGSEKRREGGASL